MAEYDLLIKNGTVVDGTRMPAYRGDIGIRNGRIVAIGNLKEGAKRVIDATGMIVAFGFAPVKPEDRDRAMRRMERTESIPLSCMQAGMRWDWVTFPEYLDSLDRGGLGVNAASLVPYSPLRAFVLGNDAARDPNYKA